MPKGCVEEVSSSTKTSYIYKANCTQGLDTSSSVTFRNNQALVGCETNSLRHRRRRQNKLPEGTLITE